MLRASRPLFAVAKTLKASTGITGVPVHSNPLPALTKVYNQTLTSLSALPATSVYRQAAEALTKHRLAVVEKANGDIPAVEKELGTIVEVALQEAESELSLSGQVAEWKVWEPLEEKPHPDQWRYFDPTGDSL
ncbi:NADH dehydrogenase [ubiquinone] 1 alpha subcomplex subunit 5 [Vanrija pseudolonga]|uniref:NADH dehydrogenase [ubiquinone] 1 alpha subcomplex subunit 5 n=1 Tax=Vanrija pseudolonga TaxID=143232 RepID=A0AAF1BS16_9TREE|nr:NADH dehydrogenase [ubiquinone] 1 alpha subcomplex subunit 5 [Vanrija pseudolonga]